MTDLEWMKVALEIAREGIGKSQTPFGAIVVKNGKLVSKAHNTVLRDINPTAHAEVNAIELAAKSLNTVDLAECAVYTTCEPCPMCLSAIHWANVSRVVYGATIEMAAECGFRELTISAKTMVKLGQSALIVDRLNDSSDCELIFKEWKSKGLSKVY